MTHCRSSSINHFCTSCDMIRRQASISFLLIWTINGASKTRWRISLFWTDVLRETSILNGNFIFGILLMRVNVMSSIEQQVTCQKELKQLCISIEENSSPFWKNKQNNSATTRFDTMIFYSRSIPTEIVHFQLEKLSPIIRPIQDKKIKW